MSVIFNAVGEAAQRTTNIVAGNSSYTCAFYLKMAAAGAGTRLAWATADALPSFTQFVSLVTDLGTLDLRLVGNNGIGGLLTSDPATLLAGQWTRVAYTRVGTTNRFYVNGVQIGANYVLDMSATTLAGVIIGGDAVASDSDVEIAYFREWDTSLSLAELNAEWFSQVPVLNSPSFLMTDTPLISDLLDDGTFGNDWTAVGALTFDATKPAFPANATRATATAIPALPFSDTQDVWSEGLAYPAWFKYTAVAGDDVIGVWGYGDNLTPYSAIPSAFVGAGTTNILLTTSNANKPTRFSVDLGVEYFFLWTPSPSAPASALLHIEAETFVQQTAPIGSIIVTDDAEADWYPLGIFSAIDGDDFNVLHYVNHIVVGEAGDVLDDGKFLLSDADGTVLTLYNGDMTIVTTVAINLGPRRSIRCCRARQTFYVGSAGNPVIVNEVNSAGAIIGTWSMTGTSTIAAIAASNDGTILYNSGTSDQPIRRWDLVNDVALSNFLPTFRQATDILVLADDTILIGYQFLTSASANFTVRRYDAAATLLDTYDFGTNLTPGGIAGRAPCRMAYALDDPDSFWVYLHPVAEPGVSVFQNVRVSDGAILAEIRQAEYNLGVYTPPASLTPLKRFGNSLSCPVFISRVEIGPPPPPPGTIIVSKVTVPPDATVFDFVTAGLIPGTFQLSHGDSRTFLNLLAGSGYSVIEIPNPLYTTVVVVSNGDPNTNITVPSGGTIMVTFTNTMVGPPPPGGPGCPTDFPVDSASLGACAPAWTP